MSLIDIVNLLPHHRNLQFPPPGYIRVVDGNSLRFLAQRAARPLLVNFCSKCSFHMLSLCRFLTGAKHVTCPIWFAGTSVVLRIAAARLLL